MSLTFVNDSIADFRAAWRCAALLALGFCAASLCACDKNAKANNSAGDKPTSSTLEVAARRAVKREYTVPVAVETILRREVKSYVQTTGIVAPVQSAPVVVEAAGRLIFEQDWRVDDYVEANELIARIDDRDARMRIQIAEAELENSRVSLDLSKARLDKALVDMERTEELVEKELAPRRQLEDAQLNIRQAQTSVSQAQNAVRKSQLDLERARKELETLEVRAPISGVLCPEEVLARANSSTRMVNPRDIMTLDGRLVPNGRTICGVIDLSQAVIRCDVTSKDIARVQIEAEAIARVYVGDDNIERVGKVREIASSIDTDTRAFQVDVLLDNEDGRLRPGMFARVDIVTAVRRDAIAVPRSCLQRRNNEDVVFVANKENQAEMRVVELGIENLDEVEIVSGLREGERLVVKGHETLQDKVRVAIDELPAEDALI